MKYILYRSQGDIDKNVKKHELTLVNMIDFYVVVFGALYN